MLFQSMTCSSTVVPGFCCSNRLWRPCQKPWFLSLYEAATILILCAAVPPLVPPPPCSLPHAARTRARLSTPARAPRTCLLTSPTFFHRQWRMPALFPYIEPIAPTSIPVLRPRSHH